MFNRKSLSEGPPPLKLFQHERLMDMPLPPFSLFMNAELMADRKKDIQGSAKHVHKHTDVTASYPLTTKQTKPNRLTPRELQYRSCVFLLKLISQLQRAFPLMGASGKSMKIH